MRSATIAANRSRCAALNTIQTAQPWPFPQDMAQYCTSQVTLIESLMTQALAISATSVSCGETAAEPAMDTMSEPAAETVDKPALEG